VFQQKNSSCPPQNLASFSLVSPNKLSDPHVVELFSKVSSWQASSSGYPLCFFTNPEELAEIYLITGWDDVAAHEKWIKSPRNQELLQIAKKILNIIGMVHLDIDFSKFPVGAESLVCTRFIGASGGISKETQRSMAHAQGAWTGYGKDVQESGTGPGVYLLLQESDTLEGVEGEGGINMKAHLKSVKFT
jgi:heme-degrading monooxygenase HmoA